MVETIPLVNYSRLNFVTTMKLLSNKRNAVRYIFEVISNRGYAIHNHRFTYSPICVTLIVDTVLNFA